MSQQLIRGVFLSALGLLVVVGSVLSRGQAAAPQKDGAKDAALERTRYETRMLDDLYKNAIVLVTKHYVKSDSDLAAGEAFKLLFESMKASGWHEVRLLDGLGAPINDSNQPRDEFERSSMKEILAGKVSVEQVETKNGKRYLRTATTLPMVMDKCIMCHSNYKGQKIVGALGYTLPIDVE